MEKIKQLYRENRYGEALRELLAQARLTEDFGTYMSLCRWRKKIGTLPDSLVKLRDLRVAILGGATTDFLAQPLKLELETIGLGGDIFCADFNNYVPELLDANGKAATFRPNVAVVLVTPFNISDWPAVSDSEEVAQVLADRICDHWLGLCEQFHAYTNCEIVLSNMHLLVTRPTGNLGAKLSGDANNFLRRVNLTLSRKAQTYVHILDIETLSATYGIANWFDPRFWHLAKQPVSFACMVPLVRNLASIIGAIYGHTAKCLVLDLDNTLWGGVVGDDGVTGIKIGEGEAEGEAFKAFQEYLLLLKKRGLLLAVCSKNEEANALEPFSTLPEMVLKREDFVSFKANWNPKPDNIEQIARELNIGLDALVFVDDNPAERELVRQSLPQVKVVELSSDPADYPRLLDQCGWLDIVKLTDEDIKKTDQYHENNQREAFQVQYSDYDSYLASLDQRAVVRAFDATYIDRVTQLINKTNQFNLTTRRMTRSEVEVMLDRNDTITAYVRLTDRFGDNGLISLVAGHVDGGVLHIDLWLMSCRVLKRGVEHLLANYLIEQAQEHGVNLVRGQYVPTEKNMMVENHYSELGFGLASTDENGTKNWEIRVQDYKPKLVRISLLRDGEE